MTERKRPKQATPGAEARYRVLFEQSPHGIVLIEPDTGRTIESNAAACRQLGYSREEFAALSVFDYEASETPEATQTHLRRVRSTGSDDFMTLHRTRNGEIRDVHVWARTVSLGSSEAVYCLYEDVTARVQAERALRENEQLLSEAESIAGLGSFVTDFSVGRWKSSEELDRIFGIDDRYDRSVEGWLALVHPEWRATMSAYLTNDVLGKRVPFDMEYQIVRENDGEERWVHGLGRLELGDSGQPVTMRGTIQDITERRRAEESRLVQSAALNAAADPMVITRRDGTIDWVNAAFTACTGYSSAEAVGKNPRDLLKSGVHDSAFYRQLWDTIVAGDVWRGEMVNRRKDGTLYPETQTITPVRDALGEISHFIAVKRDLTQENQLQAQFLQAQKMESVGLLAGGIAHDFNNLLSVILGWTEVVMADLPDGDSAKLALDEVLKASHGAAALTRQLLAFSRRQLVEPSFFDVNELVVEMEKMFRRLIGSDVELRTRTDPGLVTVNMDRGQLEQVLMNLVINARDAMSTGGVLGIATARVVRDSADLRRHAAVPPGDYVMLSVSDSGAGMSAEIKKRIFEPFFTTKERGKGTGLGLATCYGIVKQAGGHIAVDSEEGIGTTLSVYLPRCADPPARPAGTLSAFSREATTLR